MTSIVFRTLLTLGLIVPSLGGPILLTAAPAEAQSFRDYDDDDDFDRPRRQRRFERQFEDDFDRPRVQRRIIERRFVRPAIERRVIVRPVVERRFVRPVFDDCRVVVTKRFNRFGERVVVRKRICD